MPQFGLKGINCAKYVNTAGVISYTNAQKVGDAMTAQIELRFAEGRLYAEDSLAEYMKKAVGGTISMGVKYIEIAAQKLMFGMRDKTRSISYIPTGTTVTATATASSLMIGGHDEGQYVGIAFYASDMIDGVRKYTCVLIRKALFGPPSMSLQTAGESIQFNTPTTSGEFLADDSASQDLFEVAIVDDENEAKAWITEVLK